MTDKNILDFKRKSAKENDGAAPTSDRLSDLKSTLDKRLENKLAQEQAIETRKTERDNQIRNTVKKLTTGLSAAILLGGLTTAGWALAQKDNHLIQKDKDKLSLDYTQLKNRNQQLERENARLHARLDASETNSITLDKLSANLGKAVDELKANRAELVAKLNQSNTVIEQMHKDKTTQEEAFKTLTLSYQASEKNNATLNEKFNLLQSIFDQGRSVLSQSKPEPTPPEKEG